MDILELLAADHREVQATFAEYHRLAAHAFHSKQSVSARIFDSLERHAEIEEALFYPELETSTETADFVRSARVEHEELRLLLNELRETSVSEPGYETRMSALEEMFASHVGEEEEEVFPATEAVLSVDIREDLGTKAEEMRAEHEAPDDEAPEIPPVPRL